METKRDVHSIRLQNKWTLIDPQIKNCDDWDQIKKQNSSATVQPKLHHSTTSLTISTISKPHEWSSCACRHQPDCSWYDAGRKEGWCSSSSPWLQPSGVQQGEQSCSSAISTSPTDCICTETKHIQWQLNSPCITPYISKPNLSHGHKLQAQMCLILTFAFAISCSLEGVWLQPPKHQHASMRP
jgi:hypothetical protein